MKIIGAVIGIAITVLFLFMVWRLVSSFFETPREDDEVKKPDSLQSDPGKDKKNPTYDQDS